MIAKFGRDHGLFLASGVAFNLLLCSIPLTLIMISVLGHTLLESQQAMEEVESVIRRLLPPSERTYLENVAAIVADRGLLGAAGCVSFLLFSTFVFGAIRHVLNTVFQAAPGRNVWRGTAHDLLMMACGVLLVVAAIGVAWVAAVLGNLADLVPAATSWWRDGMRLVRTLAELVLAGGVIFGLFRFSPVRTLTTRALAVGSAVTVALFELAKQAFAWYVEVAQVKAALYGALGGFVFFFLWLYYAAAIFVLGAEAGWAFEQATMAKAPASRNPGGESDDPATGRGE